MQDDSLLPSLRDTIARHNLSPKKNLGQNFILDPNVTAKIVRAAGILKGKNVIEIGPGPGGLTRALLQTDAACLYAIERDDRCIAALQDIIPFSQGRLHLIAEDALQVDYASLCPDPRVVVANLPYNIATTLLLGWLHQITLFDSLTLMFQKEVAERLCAPIRTKDYGRLSVITQWLCNVEHQFDLPPSVFTPPPKVTSSVVRLTPKPRTDNIAFELMGKLTASAFGQRRKMLRQSLKTMTAEPEVLLARADIPPTCRAEEIDVDGFVRMAQALRV